MPSLCQIGLARGDEFAERASVPARCPGAHAARARCWFAASILEQFDLPDTLTAVAAVLLEHARTGRLQPRREFRTKSVGGAVQVCIGAPAEVPGAVQHLLHAHLQDGVRMCADPRATRRDIAQHRIELRRVSGLHGSDRPRRARHRRQATAPAPHRRCRRHRRPGSASMPRLPAPRTHGGNDCSAASRVRRASLSPRHRIAILPIMAASSRASGSLDEHPCRLENRECDSPMTAVAPISSGVVHLEAEQQGERHRSRSGR